MRIFSIILLLISWSVLAACSGTKTITTSKTDRDITVDGNLSGWDLEKSTVETTDSFNYYATFDDDFLYLFVDVKSLAYNNAMKQSGFIIYLADSKEKRNHAGIGFPSGTFNLLRENPGTYQAFLNDSEWSQNASNRQLLEELEEDIFNRIMVIERSDNTDAQRGFVNKDQLEVDGINIEVEEGRRLMGIELRVPLDGSSVYRISGDRIWLGFEIDPPNFRIEENDQPISGQQRYGQNGRDHQNRTSTQSSRKQRMGQYERWYQLHLSE